MAIHGGFDRALHLAELSEPLDTQEGVLSPTTRRTRMLTALAGAAMTAAQLATVAGVTAGTAAASKAVVLDSSLNIAGINNISMTGDLTVDGAVGTGASAAAVVKLTTPELTIVDNDVLGRIVFQAPLESSGTDAILEAATIEAEAEATFDATTNTTALVFKTGTSEAAAEKTRISGDGTLTHLGTFASGANATDRASIKGFYYSPANVSVTVPSIADPETDSVAVDVSAAFAIQPALGDLVIGVPMEALPTDCLFLGAYVSGTDQITCTFSAKEGGGGVTGAAVNFRFFVIDMT